MNPLELPRCVVDFETKSPRPITGPKSVGAWRYAEDPDTEIICLGYKLPGQCTKLWWPWEPFPQELLDFIEEGGVFEAHNVQFERAIWKHILLERMGIPMPKRWVDTLATCAYRSIPLGLDEAGDVLDLDVKKDKRGKYLIQQLSKPRKPLKKERQSFRDLGISEDKWPILWREDKALEREMGEYCVQDVDAEENLGEIIGDLPLPEYRLWVLDQTINQRGVYVDIDAVRKAKEITDIISERLTKELVEVTKGAIQTAGQIAKIKEWVDERGVFLPDMTADTLEYMVNHEGLPEDVRRVLEIRQQLSRASTKKLIKFLDCVCRDGRVKGLLQYHGAGTGRWAGRLIQPQNFPRGSPHIIKDMGKLIGIIKLGGQTAIDMLELTYGDPMEAVASSLRGMLIAEPGKKFLVADFSSIEAVVTAWLAGEEWKLDVFRRGECAYCATASPIVGFKVEKSIAKNPDHPEHAKHAAARQNIGKVAELAFGYQGALGAWRNFDDSDKYSDGEVEAFKNTWREKHFMTKNLWYGLEEAAVMAVRHEAPYSYRYITFDVVNDKAGKWLTARLPNGKLLWYFNPRLMEGKFGKEQVCYEGKDNDRQGRWGLVMTYGGKLTENVVQAIAREIMAEAMVRVELKGYTILLTVHDEIIVEVPEEFGSLKEFCELMAINPFWAPDCPIGVEGWEGYRYRKG